jgi:predicted MFS family arabinose efflux permease
MYYRLHYSRTVLLLLLLLLLLAGNTTTAFGQPPNFDALTMGRLLLLQQIQV